MIGYYSIFIRDFYTKKYKALPWDIKQIFDKSVQLRQLDICELSGLMVMCDLKGHVSVFRLAEFAQILSDSPSSWESHMDETQATSSSGSSSTKTKAHCKESRLDLVSGACHLYSIGKPLITPPQSKISGAKTTSDQQTYHTCQFRMLIACGRKLLLVEYTDPSLVAGNAALCNSCGTLNLATSSSSIVNSLVQNPIVGVTHLAGTISPPLLNATGLSSSTSGQNLCVLDQDRNDVIKHFYIKKVIL